MLANRRTAGIAYVAAGLCFFIVGLMMTDDSPTNFTFSVLGVSLAVIGVSVFLGQRPNS